MKKLNDIRTLFSLSIVTAIVVGMLMAYSYCARSGTAFLCFIVAFTAHAWIVDRLATIYRDESEVQQRYVGAKHVQIGHLEDRINDSNAAFTRQCELWRSFRKSIGGCAVTAITDDGKLYVLADREADLTVDTLSESMERILADKKVMDDFAVIEKAAKREQEAAEAYAQQIKGTHRHG